MNVLLLGSGGREHAIAWKIAQSPKLKKFFIAPGNAGTAAIAENVNLSITDFSALGSFCLSQEINLLIVGPEEPLVKGIVDFFRADARLAHIGIVGPDSKGAMLEGSKDFSKRFMSKFNIPTARFNSFDKNNIEEGYSFLESLKSPYVLKADGLAAGKGVLIIDDLDEAKKSLKEMIEDSMFGAASNTVVIEEFLKGIECSVFVASDGCDYKILPVAKDYKRIGEGDSGLNTGGMGAISPVPFADAEFMSKVELQIIIPTIEGLKSEGIIYKGFVFIGLMNVDGNPFVIEYNCRMGDPETEVVMPRIDSDVLELMNAIAQTKLADYQLEISKKTATTVMMVSGGYPGDYPKGFEITGMDTVKDSIPFHARTALKEGVIVTSGGRVIAVTSLDESIKEALEKSYSSIRKISFDKSYYRKDIGYEFL